MRWLVALAMMVVLTSSAMADLKWEQQEIEVYADVGTQAVKAEFGFSNAGEGSVRITQVEATCACTVAELEKKSYGKGESGKVAVTFQIGDRTGTQIKAITVRTDEAGGWVHRLFLKVHLVEPPVIAPRMVVWSVGEAAEGKRVLVTAGKEEVVHVRGVKVDGKVFEASIETVEEGKRYAVRITPKETRKAEMAAVVIETDWPKGAPRSFNVLARVMPKAKKR